MPKFTSERLLGIIKRYNERNGNYPTHSQLMGQVNVHLKTAEMKILIQELAESGKIKINSYTPTNGRMQSFIYEAI